MRKYLRCLSLAAALMALSAPAYGQQAAARATRTNPSHELGADFAAQYTNQGDGIGGGVQIAEPVDIRVAFLSASRVAFEPRLAFALDTKGTGTSTAYTFTPGLNVLYRLSRGTGTRGLIGAHYLTGGAQLNLVRTGVNNFTSSSTQFALDGGVGTRIPYGGAAIRVEGFVSYAFPTDMLPRMFAIGTRVGMSFWR